MCQSIILSVYVSLFVTFASAVGFAGPRPTDAAIDGHPSVGFSPKPTAEPRLSDLRARNLFRRQDQATDTCGYLTGDESQPFTCGSNSACIYNTISNYFGCCMTNAVGNFVSSDCPQMNTPYTACVDYASASECTGDCYIHNRVCESTSPYCGVVALHAGGTIYSEYFCQTIDPSFPTILVESTYTTSDGVSGSSLGLIITFNDPTGPTTAPNTTPTLTTSPTTSFTGPTASFTSPAPRPSPHSHAGAIAGGVVGGLIGVSALAGASILYLQKKKKRERRESTVEVSQM